MKHKPLPIGPEGPMCTAKIGVSADLFREIMVMYVPEGSMVLDLNWGTGRFWKRVNPDAYQVVGVDISEKLRSTTYAHWLARADNRCLPFKDATFDACVIDPIFGTGSTKPQTIGTAKSYNLKPLGSMQVLYSMYERCAIEARRVLKRRGLLIVKSQDEIMNARYQPIHYEHKRNVEAIGFKLVMTYVLVRNGKPNMRHAYQYNPRSNCTFWQVFRKES